MVWIETYSGLEMDYEDPKPEMITLIDIAHALSRICRFSGHSKCFYSVAQHSVLVAYCITQTGILDDFPQERHNAILRSALLHDSTEAYVGDIPSPLKSLCPEYKAIENKLWDVIAKKFGCDTDVEVMRRIKQADIRVLMSEAARLVNSGGKNWLHTLNGVQPWPEIGVKMIVLNELDSRRGLIERCRSLGIEV